jgi:hypothetical protein
VEARPFPLTGGQDHCLQFWRLSPIAFDWCGTRLMTYREWLRNPRSGRCGSSKLTIARGPAGEAEMTGRTATRSQIACGGCGIVIANCRDFLMDADPPVLPVVRSAARQCVNLPGHGP